MSAPSRRWVVERVPHLRGYVVEWVDKNAYLLSRRNELFRASTLRHPFERLGTIPAPRWKALVARLRTGQRLLRFMCYNALRLPDGSIFLTFDRMVAVWRGGRVVVLRGLVRPTRVLRAGCACGDGGQIFLGEYRSNRARDEIRIYRYETAADAVEVVHTFPAGAVRHVHGIYRDPYTGALWCVTGDRASECRMLRTWDGFRSLEVIGAGDESWRCVSVQFTRDAIYYGTDAEEAPNYIYRMARHGWRREIVGEVDGPVYYSKRVGDDLFFAVAAELWPSQREPDGSLWAVGPDGQCERLTSYRKDPWSVRFFLPGLLHFSGGESDSEFFFQGVALAGVDNETYRVRRRA